MTTYAFWNNKGGVGKSFLCFIAAAEYAHRRPETDVYVVDLCPQANVSETLLGGFPASSDALQTLYSTKVRRSIAGYLEARLNSPFRVIDDISPFLSEPTEYNSSIPANLKLICGDNLLELLSEAIRQTSQLSIPTDAWAQVICWVRDLVQQLKLISGSREAVVILDCNPSFAIYTQLALAASDFVVVPFTADDSSRRAIENVVALLYGVADENISAYAQVSFSKRAKEQRLTLPKLHTFVSNRVTLYEGRPSHAFRAASNRIKETVDDIHKRARTIFSAPSKKPSAGFLDVPDYHSASIVASMTGKPLHALTAGPKQVAGERVQINPTPLRKYKAALSQFVDCL